MTRRSVGAMLCVLVIFTTGIVLAFNEPDGFRGLPWGATEEQMRLAVSIERACIDHAADRRWVADRSCPALFDLAGIAMRAAYRFRANRFTGVFLVFPSKSFPRMTEIFSERYGAPTKREANSLFWTGKTASVTLHRYRENTPSEGWAFLTTNEDLDESARLRHEQTKGAAKGL